MNVKKLIEQLKVLDENVEVFISGYEGGYHKVMSVSGVCPVALDVNRNPYCGDHELIEDELYELKYKGARKTMGVTFNEY